MSFVLGMILFVIVIPVVFDRKLPWPIRRRAS
jgi:hypothetical protein